MKTVVAGALGECVHVAGVMNFLRLAEAAGWRTIFLGPAVPVKKMLQAARREKADLVGVSYRLTPETGERLLAEFAEEADDLRTAGVRFAFGGTPPVAERVRTIGFFERVFDGSEPPEAVLAYLKGQAHSEPAEADCPQSTVERIKWKAPFLILRHHFGLPTVKATREGIARVADAQVLDDVVFVVSAYLSAYNARAFGVRDYIAQMMFNSPPGLSDAMDLAKMLACLEVIQPLESPDFCIWRQTRTGLLSYPQDPDAARAHLAASVYRQMGLRPHIVHVVGHTEAHHAATADDVIEACKLARRSIENALRGQPDMTADPAVQERVQELVREAQITLRAVQALATSDVADPFIDPATLARAVKTGILDTPHLRGNPYARGQIAARIDGRGACVAIDSATGCPLSEEARIARLGIPIEM